MYTKIMYTTIKYNDLKECAVKTVGVREVRQNIGPLLDAVAAGEEIIITRRGKPIATMTSIKAESSEKTFPDRSQFRKQFPPAQKNSADLIRELRDEKGY